MVLDSNIIIGYLNGDDITISKLQELRSPGQVFVISSIVVAEVLAYPSHTSVTANVAADFMSTMIRVPFDDAIAELTAEFRKKYKLSLPDAAIAATAWHLSLPLATRDRQLRKVKEIEIIEW